MPAGDARHHDFDAPDLRLRGEPWRERLATVIDLATEPTTQLVTGLRGSGKTTELQQLRDQLQASGYEVRLADVGAWLSDDHPLGTVDLLFAAILGMYPDGEPNSTRGWLKEYAKQLVEVLKAEVDVTDIGPFKLRLKTNDTLFQRVAKQLSKSDRFREQAHALLTMAHERAEAPIVLILDGAEKRATGELHGSQRREEFHNHWSGNFVLNGRELRLPVHTIYTVPPFMVRRSSELAAHFDSELEFLPMVRLFDRRGQLDSVGLQEMSAAVYRRVPAEYFDHECIVPYIAACSGGYFRDALRLLTQMVLGVREQPRFTRELAEVALAKIRQTYLEGFVQEERELLGEIHETHELPRREDDQLRVDKMLLGYKVFRYHDPQPYYGIHPLLWSSFEDDSLSWDRVREVWRG